MYILLIFSSIFVSCYQNSDNLDGILPESTSNQIKINADYFKTTKNTKIRTPFLQNDHIPPCAEIVVLIEELPAHGKIQLDSTGYYYFPHLDFVGQDHFRYSVQCTVSELTHYAEVTIKVTEN